jgi:biotin-dependent carboxylase-like uncharacterized protein
VDIVAAGPATTVQDRGRPGLAHLGVPRSGALDQPAFRLANRLVGNAEEEALLEATLTGVEVRAGADCHMAVTGAPAPVTVDGGPAGWGVPVEVLAGSVLRVGGAERGVRSYLAVSGGIKVEAVLGSRSTDLLSGLGPAPLQAGDRLPVGAPQGSPAALDMAPYPSPGDDIVLEAHLGPRDDWCATRTLLAAAYKVSPDSNRVGLRLSGPPLERLRAGELPSEGAVTGAVQVPPDGQPIVLLADHPTTGGYPVVAVVTERDLAKCAQARPGATVRFRLVPSARWPAGPPRGAAE